MEMALFVQRLADNSVIMVFTARPAILLGGDLNCQPAQISHT